MRRLWFFNRLLRARFTELREQRRNVPTRETSSWMTLHKYGHVRSKGRKRNFGSREEVIRGGREWVQNSKVTGGQRKDGPDGPLPRLEDWAAECIPRRPRD